MDEGKIRIIFADQIAECDWAGGVTKDDILGALAGYPSLQEVVIQYIVDETYHSQGEFMTLIPEQAWQDAQGGEWHGGETGDIDAMNSRFNAGPAGKDAGGVFEVGEPAPPTSGFGHVRGDEAGQSPAM